MHMRPLAFSILLIPGAATADVTPQDVWDNMVAGYGSFGFDLTGTLETSGDTVTVNDGLITLTYPVIGGQMTATVPQMTLTDQGDGTVKIDSPSTYVSAITADIPEEDGQVTMDLTIAQEGLNSVASGTPGDVTYITDTSSLDILASNLVIPDENFGSFELQIDSDGYTSETRITVADSVTITNESTNRAAETMFKIDADGLRQESNATSGALVSSLVAVMPQDTDIVNLAPALRAGLSITGSTQSEGGTSVTKTFDGDTLFSEQSQVTGASNGTFGFDADGIRFDGTGESASFVLSGSEFNLPFPIELAFGEVTAKLAFPLLSSEDPQPFTYGFSVNELTVADDIWNLIDQGNALDRSPIRLAMDLSGELTNTADLVDPATWEQIEQGLVPVAPNSLSINEIGIGALGAVINATGAFTFDNDDLVTFGGFPRPEGRANASATGLNAAIDQLLAAGLIGEQDVAAPRMFMGMFAVSQGDDELTTEVEINAEGHVILNGQRIQ